MEVTVYDAWMGALGYSFQLYFDFSAYSDMAIGVGLMFGIRLPVNFFSPYKATNIVEFWRPGFSVTMCISPWAVIGKAERGDIST